MNFRAMESRSDCLSGLPACPRGTGTAKLATEAHAASCGRHACILRSEGVSVIAHPFGCVDGSRVVRPEDILTGRDGTDVFVVSAPLDVTVEVIELLPLRHRSVLLDPRPDMTAPLPALRPEPCVALVVELLCPEVAAGLGIDDVARTEARCVVATDHLDDLRVTVSVPARVVLPAPTLAVDRTATPRDRAHDTGVYQVCEMIERGVRDGL